MSKASKCFGTNSQYSKVESKKLILNQERVEDPNESELMAAVEDVSQRIEENAHTNAEFNITYSQLMQITELNAENEISEEKTHRKTKDEVSPSFEGDIDFSLLDLESMFKSGVKNQSPLRNTNLKNINLNLTNMNDKIKSNLKLIEGSDKAKEKFVLNLSQAAFEIPEEDLKMLFDNILTQRRIPEESERKEASVIIEKNKFDNLALEKVEDIVLKGEEKRNGHECNALPLVGFLVKELGNFFTRLGDQLNGQLPSESELRLPSSISRFLPLTNSQENRISHRQSFEPKTSNKVKQQRDIQDDFDDYLRNLKSANRNNEIVKPNFTSTICNKQTLNFTNNKKEVNMMNINSNFENKAFNAANNININNVNKVNPFTTGNKIQPLDKSNNINFSNPGNKPYNKSLDFEDMEIKGNLKDIQDDEFDSFLKNAKKGKMNTKSDANPFMKGQDLKGSQPMSSANNKFTLEEDDEFDSFLNKAKKQAMTNKGSFKPQENVITSDFKCGNENVSYKANQRVQSIIQEMEKDYEDEFTTIEQEKKTIKPKENKKDNKENIKESKPLNGQANKAYKPPKLINPPVENNIKKKLASNSKNLPSSKKIKINEFSSEKLNSKRLYSDHVNSLDPETRKNINQQQNNNKKFKSTGTFKIYDANKEKNQNMNKVTSNTKSSIVTSNNNLPQSQKLPQQSQQLQPTEINKLNKALFITNIDQIEFECLCKATNQCKICKGKGIVTINNFSAVFINYYSSNKSKLENLTKSQEEFIQYQFKIVAWKYFILSKYSDDPTIFSLENILKKVTKKFGIIFEEGRRSILMKVAEKDASVNKYLILLILNITKEGDSHTIELTDGYKSVFTVINATNPISNLISRNIIFPGLKLSLGLAKVDRITDDFSICISVYYNSLSKAAADSKLGAQKDRKFLLKNVANIREDGGEVSLIDVIILKKYEYYCQDFSKKEKLSAAKMEKLIEDYNDSFTKEWNESKLKEPAKFPYDNINYIFKIVCVDSLLYLNSLKEFGVNSEIELKKSLKTKLNRKCVIEFTVKNKNIYESLVQGNRYQLGLLNISKAQANNNKIYNDPKIVKLKANDSVLIKEIKINKSSTGNVVSTHQRAILEMSRQLTIPAEDLDISEFLHTNSFNSSLTANEEVSFSGMFLREHKPDKSDKSLFLFFVNNHDNFAIIKVHDESFFDLTKFIGKSSNCWYTIKNLNFQIIYYFDPQMKSLGTFKNDKKYEKGFDNNSIVLYMETSNYTTLKSVTKKKETIKYDENLLQDIMKSV